MKYKTYSQTTIYWARSTSPQSFPRRSFFQFYQRSLPTPVFAKKSLVDHEFPNSFITTTNFIWFQAYLVDFAIKLHHLGRFHEFLLKRAPYSLPVFPLSAKQQPGLSAHPGKSSSCASSCASRTSDGHFLYEWRKKPTYRISSPYASSLRSLYAVQGLISSLWG